MRTRLIAGSLSVLLAVTATSAAPLGTTFTYQGLLKNAGSPANGLHDLRFSLYDADVGGTQVGTTLCADNVSVTDGLFTVMLDFGAQFTGQERFLAVEVRADTGLNCLNSAGFTPLTSRQPLTAAPHALFASNADQLDGLDSTAFLTSVPNPLTLTGSSASHIIRGENASTAAGSAGVSGISTAAGSQTYGGDFRSSSPAGFGVYGEGGGVGLFGVSTNTSGSSFGGFFQSPSTSGIGVHGLATAAIGYTYGMWAQSNSTDGRGVYGLATAATGPTYGVLGQSNSTSGVGVQGYASNASGTNYGVHGASASPSGFGVFSDGNMHATGVISGNGSGLTDVNAALLGGFSSSAFLQSIPNPLDLTGSGAHVIMAQNTSPDSGVAVQGLATAATGTTIGGRFESASDEGIGVLGLATTTMANGYTSGVQGQAASSIGRGVFGLATFGSGVNYGVWGQSDSSSGRGVYGYASAGSGTSFGVWGQSNSTSGRGVYGYAGAGSGTTFGGSFETSSSGTDATGVFGLASALSGTTYGVWGKSNSTSGIGVLGINDRTSGTTYGVYGRSSSPNGRGVYGLADAYGGTTYGVYGQQFDIGGFGVYANGNMGAFGTKPFRIDHPDDPANKYLLHYAAESPEVINFYRGIVILDGAGEAVVELPHYFAKINRAPSYQLTAIGVPMPMLHVADVIDEASLSAGARAEPGEAAPKCSFRIAGGAPGARVSWRVEAVRNDRWVQRGGAPVEVEKQGLEKGTYQHPELYGQPPEKGMNYDAERGARRSHEPPPGDPRVDTAVGDKE